MDLEKQLERSLNQFKREHFELTQKAIEKTATDVKNVLQRTTASRGHVDTGSFIKSWDYKKYPNVAYVHSNRLSNIIEYSKRGPRKFILQTYQANETKFATELVNDIKKRIRRNLK